MLKNFAYAIGTKISYVIPFCYQLHLPDQACFREFSMSSVFELYAEHSCVHRPYYGADA